MLFARVSLALILLGCGSPPAEPDEGTRQAIDQLIRNQAQLQREVAELKTKLRSGAIFQPVDLALEGVSFTGAADAPVTLVEFMDYQCSYCRRHANQAMPLLVKHYIETGKLRYGVREFPVADQHADGFELAQAMLCAGDQARYWELRQRVLRTDGSVPTLASAKRAAAELNLDTDAFEGCLSSEKYAAQVRRDVESGAEIGVSGTPSFYLGRSGSAGAERFVATRLLRGARPYTVFKQEIEALLVGTPDPNPS